MRRPLLRAGLALLLVLGWVLGCVPGCAPTFDTTYNYCADQERCAAPDRCVTITTELTESAMCAPTCETDEDCEPRGPWPGSCLPYFSEGASVCYQRCSQDTDCYLTSSCNEVIDPATDRIIARVCVPFYE